MGLGKPLLFLWNMVSRSTRSIICKILKEKVLPWSKKHFGKSEWVFQQDSAPAHRAKTVQTWCAKNFPDFISWNQWPPSSPDLNPMDFSIWNILKKRVCKKRHKDLKSLELTLKKEWTKIGSGINSKVLWTIHEKNQALCGSKRETFWQKIDLLFFFFFFFFFFLFYIYWLKKNFN